MAGTVTPSFQQFVRKMQRGGDRGYTLKPVKADIRKNVLARQAIFGRKLTGRQEIRTVQGLQKADPASFSHKSAWTTYNRLAREEAMKQSLAEKQEAARAPKAMTIDRDRWREQHEEKEKEARRHILAVEARGKEAAVAARGHAYANIQAVQEAKKERERQRKELAEKDPKQLAKFANSIF